MLRHGSIVTVGLLLSLATPLAALAQDAPEKPVTGAESPSAAVEALLAAWKAKDEATFGAMIVEKDRAVAVKMVGVAEVTKYAVGEASEPKDDEVKVEFTWKVDVDSKAFMASLIESAKEEGADNGASEKEIAEQVTMLETMLPQIVPQVKAHFEKEKHTMTVVKVDGRWYVLEPIEAAEGM